MALDIVCRPYARLAAAAVVGRLHTTPDAVAEAVLGRIRALTSSPSVVCSLCALPSTVAVIDRHLVGLQLRTERDSVIYLEYECLFKQCVAVVCLPCPWSA